MKLALFNDFQLGLVKEEMIYDISLLLPNPTGGCPMTLLIEHFDDYKTTIEQEYHRQPSYRLNDVRLRQPLSRPGKIVAAPVNYMSHKKEMNVDHTARVLGFFLKATTSIIGPNDPIILPYNNRRIDHELELAFVIGKRAKHVKKENAHDYIFGYTGLNDVTVRPTKNREEERCLRKSFDTFTPIGPWIVTSDEIKDPQNLTISLQVNHEVRQHVNTNQMVCGIAELVEIFSHVMTLEPGDLIATGTPDGVGPIKDGDTVTLQMESIGSFSNPVVLE
ncbi:fumarylacetoacetate hydrolase family protein [Halalkalibacterium halodurans]|uniref:2-hydroxyhepta-2,4-diene-1,7-dioate isomerase n=1 Tax=Halalkalibacterium halodurans (strain ATCC BAA-125 / DSM 18197 / FERM 7344 / JCM 9153 / C-125) TaxID=272558 RepID=Q9KBC3_HALH5|nr:fumarylacetoacetate hydrolase family protein [Halalkalibacterium halodurans]MDY7222564.1 fumarylacetoacetate hydrolase family protein [Halalkalibacterium halodurans]MDY7241785.1 fumarylacetoacetate hydrolase family protein [Halalkalibacterium halodurans]MED4123961.1 fumarylacetoacetate hydrolase family protein [Halalkalibacterium halodurans]BAB05724.1 2-hydroxyhepta-2,4-diene-1,7-dioate isomerase [Halalkalibacterium halodurans C-125]